MGARHRATLALGAVWSPPSSAWAPAVGLGGPQGLLVPDAAFGSEMGGRASGLCGICLSPSFPTTFDFRFPNSAVLLGQPELAGAWASIQRVLGIFSSSLVNDAQPHCVWAWSGSPSVRGSGGESCVEGLGAAGGDTGKWWHEMQAREDPKGAGAEGRAPTFSELAGGACLLTDSLLFVSLLLDSR